MVEVMYLKLFPSDVVFRGYGELKDRDGIKIINAKSFPHTEHYLRVISFIGLPNGLKGELSGYITGTNVQFDCLGERLIVQDLWFAFNQKLRGITFPSEGNYNIVLTLDGEPIEQTTIKVTSV